MKDTSGSGYDFVSIQKKWNERWEGLSLARAEDFSQKPKLYALVELPYPSGSGLHMGHCWNYALFDTYSRFHRLLGYNVLYPMGWDAFGLPTYNHAIKVGKDPHEVSAESITTFRRQLKELGLAFDWEREIDSSSPEYYKWTQWIFVQLYEHWYDGTFARKDGGVGQARPMSDLPIPDEVRQKGESAITEYKDAKRLAFKKKMPVSWCPKCKTGLANEEVLGDGTHERCGTLVEKRDLEQWMLRITAYAERLLADLDTVDFPNGVKAAQKNWIGKKYGVNITYDVVTEDGQKVSEVTCFTSRPETNFGATFVVVAPEHAILEELGQYMDEVTKKNVLEYKNTSARKTKEQREAEGKKKTGVNTGLYCLNQLTGTKMPLCVSDFVLVDFGTGALVGVPGHDLRDFQFAQVMNLPVVRVVTTEGGDESEITQESQVQEESGVMINSGFLDGMEIHEATTKMMDYLEEKGWGKKITVYRFHDWVFSRQHYWGEPTPMVHCEQCGWNPVPMNQLPVTLPKLADYRMGEDGSSPLEKADEWIQVSCPSCGGKARRETDVMPNWAGSNWYFLRYLDPHNKEKLVDQTIASYWMPVDIYYGGQEHVTLHLLYSRFIYKFLSDLGAVPGVEPYKQRRNHGIILGPDNRKMSKSWGNVVNPDEVVGKFGADVVRLYLMFIGPYESVTPWNERSVIGVHRFVVKLIKKLKKECTVVNRDKEVGENGISIGLSRLKQRVRGDIVLLKFNTIVASFMEFLNTYEKNPWPYEIIKEFLILLSPFAPYVSEELWEVLGEKGSVHQQELKIADVTQGVHSEIDLPVMVNGKLRAKISVMSNATEADVVTLATQAAPQYLSQGYAKVIYVPGKAVNFVVR